MGRQSRQKALEGSSGRAVYVGSVQLFIPVTELGLERAKIDVIRQRLHTCLPGRESKV